jgi:hypothetical protein
MAAGLRYQLRHFWLNALPMLYQQGSHVAEVEMECRDVNAVDDLKVVYRQPGINDAGALVDIDFFQIKFHVAQADHVNAQALINPAWSGTREPMLKRFWIAWQRLRPKTNNPRLILRTNWPWDRACPLAPLLRDDGRLSQAFITKEATTKVGKIRANWQEACDAADDQAFAEFLQALRFQSSASSLAETEDWLRDRCRLAGVKAVPAETEWNPYDDLGKRLLETGRTRHTAESLRELLRLNNLLEPPSEPKSTTVLLRSFRSLDPVAENEGQLVIDLCDLFEDRQPKTATAWSTTIPERLRTAAARIAALPGPIDLKIQAHLSIAWYLGSLLPPKTGVSFMLRQLDARMREMVWDDSPPRCPDGAAGWALEGALLGQGEELAVAVSVSRDVLADVLAHLIANPGPISSLLHATLQPPGQHAIANGAHGRWLADALITQLSRMVADRRPARIHVFAACPVNFMVLLGQQSAALGPTSVYEFAFGSPGRSYVAAMHT